MNTYNNAQFDALAGQSNYPSSRTFLTRASFSRQEAAAALPHINTSAIFDEYPDRQRLTLGGYLVTDKAEDWQQAQEIAAQRGFGEQLDGVFRGGYSGAGMWVPRRFA